MRTTGIVSSAITLSLLVAAIRGFIKPTPAFHRRPVDFYN
jgi:hypothetical protein